MRNVMKKYRKFSKVMAKRWREASIMIVILTFAAIMTIFRPVNPDTVSYFSDVTTPLILVVAVILIIVGVRERTQII